MRADSPAIAGHMTIPAECTQNRGIAILNSPLSCFSSEPILFSEFPATTVDMIKCKEFNPPFLTTSTVLPVMFQGKAFEVSVSFTRPTVLFKSHTGTAE